MAVSGQGECAMKAHFQMFAAYNRWANARLYAAAFALSDEAYRRDVGLFFGSVHRTLNHLALTDRMWIGRIDRTEATPGPLDRVLYEDRGELWRTRLATDQRLVALVDGVPVNRFAVEHHYRNTAGNAFVQALDQILAHLFNHQTHHRGQVHGGLSMLGKAPPSLDLLAFQRGVPAPDPSELLDAA
jgi:uncharacterized damage-inducible protein DinB